MSTEGSPQTRPPRPAVPPRSSPRWTPPRRSSTSNPSWTMNSSARTPWTWASCLVACVDLTLEEEEFGRRLRSTSRPQGRPSSGSGRSADAYRSSEGSSGSHSRHQHGSYHMDSRSSRDCRAYRVGGSSRHPEWETRKRKAPVVSSVVRVNQAADEGPDSDELEEEDDEEDEGYGVKSMSSRVSMPSKPEHSLVGLEPSVNVLAAPSTTPLPRSLPDTPSSGLRPEQLDYKRRAAETD
ncbi:zinc finger CCCH domain-containing protein 14-like isoform X3 [Salvelinus sp. IW2-2015]|uniref:zinc finger CCCH domain-containing protein 14-like isoform X3 n=1 Tax=Salvelinus sp. IW2-2015 TaxID=2691554 RepID=UPI000CEB204F|nr:zinc finger CCCH domain-containing protein 14-like isoform X1 [Salvelinus alpinus]